MSAALKSLANALGLPFLSAIFCCEIAGYAVSLVPGVGIVIYLARIFVVDRLLCSIRVLVSCVANFVDTWRALTAWASRST